MKNFIIILGLPVMISAMACNNPSGNKQDSVDSARQENKKVVSVNTDVSEFVTKAASGGMLEVQAGEMAQQKGQSQRVKDFGTMMLRDHTKANDELKMLAGQESITVPATLSDAHQKHLDELSKQSGKDFDKAYIDMMLSDHKGDIDLFNKAAKDLSDNAIKGYAAKTLPVLQMHLDSVKAIKENMK